MLISSIFAGIQVISSVNSIIRSLEQKRYNKEFNNELRKISIRLSLLQKHIEQLDMRLEAPPKLVNRYNNLISIARENELFSKYIRFYRTQKGIWMFARKRKSSILRDPLGEYYKDIND
ncbi:MAG: hypothetical protein ACYSRZ_00640 [Planctomycetota bacterium]|jgi:hypothetical protein